MKTAIIYMTQHGTTGKVVQKLSEKLSGEVDSFNLKSKPSIDLNQYDQVLIGGSIHAGSIQRKIREFCTSHLEIIANMKHGLFMCCMHDGEIRQKQFLEAFPEELRKNATACGLFGGEFLMEEMNFIERFITKKVADAHETVSKLEWDKIDEFAETFNP